MKTSRRAVCWIAAVTSIFLLSSSQTWAQDAPVDEAAPAANADESVAQDDEAVADDEILEGEENPEDEDAGEITVTAPLRNLGTVGGSARRLGEKDLEALEYDDPHSTLAQVSGVYMRQEDAFGLRPNIGLRGANSDRSKKVSLMEDGVLFGPAPYAAPAAYYFPIMTRMTAVEVFKGPGAILYGPNTIGGAINLQTREIPYKTSGEIDLALGQFLTGKAHGWVGTSWDWGGVLIEGVHLQSDGFKELDTGGDTGFAKDEVMFKGSLNSSADDFDFHRLTLKLGYARESSDETYLGLSDADFEENPYRRYSASDKDHFDWTRTQVQLDYELELGDDIDVTITGYRHDFTRAWQKLNQFQGGPTLEAILADPTNGRRQVYYDVLTGAEDSVGGDDTLVLGTNDRTYYSHGVQMISRHRIKGSGWSNSAEFGVRLHQDQIERHHFSDGFLMQSGQLVSDGLDTVTTVRNRDTANALAVHLVDQVALGPVTIAPGLRMESINTERVNLMNGADRTPQKNDDLIFMPGVGVHYELVPGFGLLGGVHRGFSPVAPGQSNEVLPETSVNYEAGARYSQEDTGSLVELVGFFSDYNNLSGQCSFSTGCSDEDLDRQFNAGEVDVYGVEFASAYEAKVASLKIPIRLAYTWTTNEFLTDFSSKNPQYGEVLAGDSLPYVPQHQASLFVGVGQEAWHLNVATTYTSEMLEEAGLFEDDDVLKTDSLFFVDLKADYTIFDGFKIYGKVDNVLNTQPIVSRRPFGARPSRPFLSQAGVKYAF